MIYQESIDLQTENFYKRLADSWKAGKNFPSVSLPFGEVRWPEVAAIEFPGEVLALAGQRHGIARTGEA